MNSFKVCVVLGLVGVLTIPALSAKTKAGGAKPKNNEQELDEKDQARAKKFRPEDDVEYLVTEEVYLDIDVIDYYGPKDHLSGRLTIAMFGDIVPMTTLNFISLCKGFKKRNALYKYAGTQIHRVVQDFIIQGGDVTHKNGEGGMSLYGPIFDDENYKISHMSAGIVSMANYGRNSNASQFFILLQKSRWLNQRHVAFGKVIKGYNLLRKIGSIKSSQKGTLYYKIKIVDSGVNSIPAKYELTKEQMESEEDIE